MRKIFLCLLVCASVFSFAQTVKSKILKLKYTTPEGWTASEFGGLKNWDESGNAMCRCSGIAFSKPHKNGKFNVVVYAVPAGGLDSAKREFVGNLRFVNVEKVEKTTNKGFSFEKRRSNFVDVKTKANSYKLYPLHFKTNRRTLLYHVRLARKHRFTELYIRKRINRND